MNLSFWVDAVCDRTGLDSAEAAGVLAATMRALGEGLRASERQVLVDALPTALAAALLDEPDSHEVTGRAKLVGRLAALEGVSLGLATELAQVVCGVLALALPHERLVFLRARLADDLAAFFIARHQDERELADPPERPRVAPPPAPRSLAEGRPGSTHPLSEGRPPAGQSGSVVATGPDVRGGRRLATSRGLAQEQLHETLAEGRPGSSHPLSERGR